MMKIFLLLVFLIVFPSLLMAQSQGEDRRIEEQKRESLRPSESRIVEEKKAIPPTLDPIDLLYFAELMLKRIAYRYDASKALVILMGVENQHIALDSQIHFFKKTNILPKRFGSEFDPMEPLRKGLTAYMFSKALGIKGGLILRLFGMNERYALKELVYQGMMSSGNVKDIVSGEELISILTQAGNHRANMRERDGGKAKGMK